MSTLNTSKLTKMLREHRPGTVSLAPYLISLGISRELQKRYRQSGWLETVGPGAFKLPQDTLNWRGGVYALQVQATLDVHPGARTALALQGFAHYARGEAETVYLFSPTKTSLPAWFKKYDWRQPVRHVLTSVFPSAVGLVEYEDKTFTIQISSPERAMLECLHLAPEEMDLSECFHLMEGLVNLRPAVVQKLLSACTSVKVKRLFLFMAEKANHQWFKRIDTAQVDLGKGHRRLTTSGIYVSKYGLTVPKELGS